MCTPCTRQKHTHVLVAELCYKLTGPQRPAQLDDTSAVQNDIFEVTLSSQLPCKWLSIPMVTRHCPLLHLLAEFLLQACHPHR